MTRQIFRFLQQRADVAGKVATLADDANLHVALVQLGEIVTDKASQQRQQILDFRRRPRPVFRAEGKNRQDRNAKFARGPHGFAQRLDTAAMPFYPRQTTRSRPASVTIHDDSDVSGDVEAAPCLQRLLDLAVRAQTVMISFSFAASIFSTSAMVASVAFCTSLDWRV